MRATRPQAANRRTRSGNPRTRSVSALNSSAACTNGFRSPWARRRARCRRPTAPICLESVSDDILGYGPIDRFLTDPTVSEIMVNGPEQVFVEREGKLQRAGVRFMDGDHLRQLIDKIVSQAGRRVDESSPMVDARLPDGSRVNAVVAPLAVGGPFLTIRKFSRRSASGQRPHQHRARSAAGGHVLGVVRRRAAQHSRVRRYRHR